MATRTRSIILILGIICMAIVCSADVHRAGHVIWVDFDMNNIAEPKERENGYWEYFFESQFFEQGNQLSTPVRLARRATGHPKRAANINDLDEVPNSSWYTNRHHLRRMTLEELNQGPDRSADAPDFSQATITKAKTVGVTPGLQLKDRKGAVYLIKFDHADFPELQSAAEVISTKILYAAGYNVPENFVAFVDAKNLQIGDGVEITDQTKKKRPFTREDLDEMLRRVAKTSDGRYRVLASKFLPGKPKGPFPQIGMRRDDPNDLIPHEHRRELRGLRVIASWINHWDMKEENGLDMYVDEGGRKFLRHYLIDFGSTLGGGNHPLEYFHGREYAFDFRNIMKEVFTLGMYVTPSEKEGTLISPAVGLFSANDFDPAAWRSSYPVAPFEEMTDEDAFWATRIILSFTETELQSIIGTARYSSSRDAEYLLRTLLERRRIIARYWLSKTNPISDFSVAPAQRELL